MSEEPKAPMKVREMVVLRVTAKMLIPFILLYALYVQFHGDFGPGGGFQAGVITAAGLILYGLVFGLDQLKRAVPQRVLEITLAIGLLMYGGTGWVTLLLGGNFLEYGYLAQHHPVHGQHYGIAMIEGGVGVGVASGLLVIYYALAGRGRR